MIICIENPSVNLANLVIRYKMGNNKVAFLLSYKRS